ncbi:MAG: patatin family protein, partial [Gemmatimonadetes bacterium]|nr:patatin family protein [Gemmatimonadota bacterium]
MAHVGVWRWLRESGVHVDGVIGCSIGALVGACICSGMDAFDMVRIAKALERKD